MKHAKRVDAIVHMEMPVNLTKHGISTMECVASKRVALKSLTLGMTGLQTDR